MQTCKTVHARLPMAHCGSCCLCSSISSIISRSSSNKLRMANNRKFKDNHRIQNSITLAWNKTQEYYTKTDASTSWMAALVLHPRWKWAYFQNKWTGSEARFVEPGKKKLKKLWETSYKKENPSTGRAERSPTPEKTSSFLED